MDNKFYISYVAAMLLKEKGYDKPTDYIYVIDGPFYSIWRNKDGNMESNYYPAPTKAEAIDWLESKGIVIEISIDIDECAWMFNIVDKEKFITIGHPKDGEFFTDRLEAEEAAIIKALKLLKGKEE